MKRKLIWILAVFLVLVATSGQAVADTSWPESAHPYESDVDETWEYEHPESVAWLRVVFSSETETEEGYDFITITDSKGTATKYDGDGLSGKTVYLPGDHFTIGLTSDGSVTEYGFSITDIQGLTQEEYEAASNSFSGSCGENVTWTMDRKTGTLTIGGSGPMKDYASLEDGDWWLYSPPYWSWDASVSVEESRSQIQHIVVEEGVTSIGGGAFRDLDGLQSIQIASTVTSIGGWAFDKSTAIQEIALPDGITVIDDSTFSDCHSLQTVNIPSGVETIGPYAFYGTDISGITLPTSLTSIGDWAFCDTPLSEVSIPASVSSIGDRAFYECTSLQNVWVNEDSQSFKSVGGVLFTKDGTEMVCYCPGRTDSFYQVPDDVQTIRPSSFSYTASLEDVKLPDSLVTIRDWAFGHTGLKQITLPQNVQRIESKAFGACESLTSATLPVSLTEIGDGVFGGCPLSEVSYEGTEAEWNAINIGDDNETLLGATFYYSASPYCSHADMIHHAEVPHTCTVDGSIAYWECGLCGNKFLDEGATQRVADTVIPASHSYQSSVTAQPTCSEVGTRTYTCTVCDEGTEGHSWTEEIPATGEHNYVDGHCVNVLRDGVTVCGRQQPDVVASGKCGYVSSGMDNMISIVLYPGQSLNYDRLCADTVLWSLDSDGTLTISGQGDMCTCILVYRGDNYGNTSFGFVSSPWYDYRSQIKRVVIGQGVTDIGLRCFYNCGSITSVELPDTLTVISSGAFHNTGSLRDVYFGGTRSQWGSVLNYGLDTDDVTLHFDELLTPDLSRDGWVDLGSGRKGYVRRGALVTGWMDLGNSKYWFRSDGVMATGWTNVEVNGNTMHYYFNPASGNLVRNTWFQINGKTYYFRPSGNLATGWATINDNGVDKKYYLDESGQLLTGWQDIEVNGNTMHYYFRPSGAMATGWADIDGTKYYFRPSGNMATGWADVNGNKHYFDEEGRMLTGWQDIGGKRYYFRASGAMQTGTATIDGKSYTFSASGVLVS